MFTSKVILRWISSSIMPNNFISKIIIPKNFIHFTLDIVTCMPVTVDIDWSSVFEHSFHLPQTGIEPGEIGGHTILEYITERADFIVISPDLRVGTIGEKWWVDIDEVDRFWRYISEDWEIISEIQFMRWEFWMSKWECVFWVMRLWWEENREMNIGKEMIEPWFWIISIGFDLWIR